MSIRSKNLASAAFIFMIGLLVFCCAILSFASGPLRANWFIYLVFGIIGVYALTASSRTLFLEWKKPTFESAFPISLPNSVIIVAPCEMNGGKALIYLPGGTRIYRGEITLFSKQKDNRLELSKVFLYGTKPSFSIPIPTWLKWLNVKEAGTVLDFWPKGTFNSFGPVVICFVQTIAQGDTIEVGMDVTSVLKPISGGKNGNESNADSVTVCFTT